MRVTQQDDRSAFSRFAGKGVYPVQYAWLLTNPARRLIAPARRLVQILHLNPRDQVLEIGCGPGYFSPAVARAVPQGRLTLFDFQDGMLDLAESRLRQQGLSNYERHRGDAKALPFADGTFDIAFMVTVLGEVGDPRTALREAARVLKPGGRLSITEMMGDPDFVTIAQLRTMAEIAGLAFERQYGPNFYYSCNFRKP